MKAQVKLKNICIGITAILSVACNVQHEWQVAEHLRLEQVVVPVVKGKSIPIAKLKFELEEPTLFSSMALEIKSEAVVTEVKLIRNESNNSSSLGVFQPSGEGWKLNLEEDLTEGIHEFNIAITVSAQANIKERMDVKVKELVLNEKKWIPAGQESFLPYRLAQSIRTKGDDGVHTYRIPGLATSNSGTLLAVYDVRHDQSSDLQGDVDVGLSRSKDGGQNWESMKIIMDMGEWGDLPEDQNGIGDPAILIDKETGTIWVIALWLHGKPGTAAWNSSESGLEPAQTGQVMLVKSDDDGITWSEPINITKPMKDPDWKLFFNGPGKGITMQDGTLVFAGQYKDADNMPNSTIIFSKDKGKTWEVGTGAKSNTTEAQLVELDKGRLMLNMRDNRGGSRSVAVTEDLGKTWVEHASSRSALIEPICMASIINYKDEMLFFSNPAATDGRYNMTIKASLDNGNSWPEDMQLLLDQEMSAGYSCLALVDSTHIGIIYESSQAHLVFQLVPVDELMGQ